MCGRLLRSLLLKIKRRFSAPPPEPPVVRPRNRKPVTFDLYNKNNWLIQVKEPVGSRDEIIDGYIKLVAKVLGSEEEAREKIYAVSTKYYFAISLLVSEEVANRFKELPEVKMVENDCYVDRATKDFGGEPFVDGKPVPYDPKYHAFYFSVQERIRARRLADGRSVEEVDRKIAEAGMSVGEVERKFGKPVNVESGEDGSSEEYDEIVPLTC